MMKVAVIFMCVALANATQQAAQTAQMDGQDFSSILVTAAPTSFAPTAMPTEEPTVEPSAEPTVEPTQTEEPTAEPTEEPTAVPTAPPTQGPTACCRPKPEPCLDGSHGCDPYSTVCASLEIVQNGYGYNRTYFCECLVGFEPSDEIFKCCPPEGCETPAPTKEPSVSPTPEPSVEPTEQPTEEPSVAPTAAPTLCKEYCCQDQLVLWHIPGSESHACDDYGEVVQKESDIESCHKLCVQDTHCLYFSVSETGDCYHGEFCGGEMKEHAEQLPKDATNPGGIYQLYCAMEGSIEQTCTGKPTYDKEVGFLTYCFDKCEDATECSYFVYHEHTSQCQLFDECAGFEAAGDDQALIYMMHEEAFGKDSGAMKAHHHKHGHGDFDKEEEEAAAAAEATAPADEAADVEVAADGAEQIVFEESARSESVRVSTGSASQYAAVIAASGGVALFALLVVAVHFRRTRAQAPLMASSAMDHSDLASI